MMFFRTKSRRLFFIEALKTRFTTLVGNNKVYGRQQKLRRPLIVFPKWYSVRQPDRISLRWNSVQEAMTSVTSQPNEYLKESTHQGESFTARAFGTVVILFLIVVSFVFLDRIDRTRQ
uniref:Uncharacterized protein n=1 Tax=Ascaris lumbricoides TaxID=6252 RepID=A0A0M3IVA4_ASCLU